MNILPSAAMPKAAYQSSTLGTTPLTRYIGGGGSDSTWLRSDSSRWIARHTWP